MRTIESRISMYAAKIAAETVCAEPPASPDLSDAAITERLSHCANPPRPEWIHRIREAFVTEYWHEPQLKQAALM